MIKFSCSIQNNEQLVFVVCQIHLPHPLYTYILHIVFPAHNRGEPLDVKARQQFHLVFWRQASLAYEKSEFKKALSWYNYSLSLFPTCEDKDDNIAKLQVCTYVHACISISTPQYLILGEQFSCFIS